MRCFLHVISFSLHCCVINRDEGGMDHIPITRITMEKKKINNLNQTLTNPRASDMGAPLNHLIQSGFVQAPRKGRILQLIPQTSGTAPFYRHCVLSWIQHIFWHLTRALLWELGHGKFSQFFFFFSKLPLWKNHNSTSTIHHILNLVDGIIQMAQGSLRISIWINFF